MLEHGLAIRNAELGNDIRRRQTRVTLFSAVDQGKRPTLSTYRRAMDAIVPESVDRTELRVSAAEKRRPRVKAERERILRTIFERDIRIARRFKEETVDGPIQTLPGLIKSELDIIATLETARKTI